MMGLFAVLPRALFFLIVKLRSNLQRAQYVEDGVGPHLLKIRNLGWFKAFLLRLIDDGRLVRS